VLTEETFKKELKGAVRTFTAADFTKVFKKWFECCTKCIGITGGDVEKKL
jgi:hypothetical protein